LKRTEIEEHLLPVASSQIYVQSYGDPSLPVLLLTHGYLQSSQCWRSVVEELSHSYQVIVWDLPGHGFSGPTQGTITAAHLAESLRAIVLRYHLEEQGFALAAWSLGGMVVREYLLRYGTTGMTHVILIAALTTLLNLQEVWAGEAEGHANATMMAHLASPDASLIERERALKSFVQKLTYQSPTVSAYYETLGYNAQALMLQAQAPLDLTSFTEVGAATMLKSLSLPVLLVYGSEDGLVPHAYLKAQMESLPYTALLQIYSGCGHSPHLEMPETFLADLHAFLQPERQAFQRVF
jgi:pimeloyl-ACP methyl ester carboxylesterase